jgi:tubulin polyglutamylase TTLL4
MSWQSIWQQVQDIAAKALIAAEPALGSATRLAAPHRNNCFEVFGMDVLLDDAGRAWLIEVD